MELTDPAAGPPPAEPAFAAQPKQFPRTGRRWRLSGVWWGYLYMNVGLALAALAAIFDWPESTMLPLGLVMGLGWLVPVFVPLPGMRFPPGIGRLLVMFGVAFMAPLLCVNTGARGLALAYRGPWVQDLAPAEVVQHPTATGFTFLGGTRGRADLAGKVTTRQAKTPVDYFAVPVVGADWQPGEPITVWTFVRQAIPAPLTEGNYRAGFRKDPAAAMMPDFEKAIASAEQEHQLVSAPGAMRLDMDTSLEVLLWRQYFFLILGVLGPNLVWSFAIWWSSDPTPDEL